MRLNQQDYRQLLPKEYQLHRRVQGRHHHHLHRLYLLKNLLSKKLCLVHQLHQK
jgi:hypothetical protein